MKKIINIGVGTTVLFLTAVGLNGCIGDYAPIQIGKNVYTFTGTTRSSTYHDALEYCKRLGLVMKPLSERGKNKGLYDVTLDFKCLSPNSQEYIKYSEYEVSSDVSIKVDKKVNINK